MPSGPHGSAAVEPLPSASGSPAGVANTSITAISATTASTKPPDDRSVRMRRESAPVGAAERVTRGAASAHPTL
ncbi:hypothetical protein ACFPRL_11640 [Pseudoclavibacter helvolus]